MTAAPSPCACCAPIRLPPTPALTQAERLRADAAKLAARYSQPDRTLEVCDVSAALSWHSVSWRQPMKGCPRPQASSGAFLAHLGCRPAAPPPPPTPCTSSSRSTCARAGLTPGCRSAACSFSRQTARRGGATTWRASSTWVGGLCHGATSAGVRRGIASAPPGRRPLVLGGEGAGRRHDLALPELPCCACPACRQAGWPSGRSTGSCRPSMQAAQRPWGPPGAQRPPAGYAPHAVCCAVRCGNKRPASTPCPDCSL